MRAAAALTVVLASLVPSTRALPQSPPIPRWAAAVDSMMARELAASRTPGAQIAIVQRGQLVYTRGYGLADVEMGRAVTDRTLFQIGSVTKLVTGVLLSQLATEKAVDLQSPISRYVTEVAGKRVGAATTHQLLTHSAGWAAGSAAFGRLDDAALGDAFRVISDTMMLSEPGRVPSYSNPGFSMAGYVAERATGRRYADLVDSLILRKLGMPRATFRPMVAMTYDFSQGYMVPPQGAASIQRPVPGNAADWPAGFLYASAAEFARLAIALMGGGEIEGRRAFAADAVRLLTGAYVAIPGEPFMRYGYGMTVDTVRGRRVWQKSGGVPGFQALVTMWPDDQFAVVVHINARTEINDRVTEQAARIAGGLAAPHEIAYRGERDATSAERAALVGTYTTRQGTVVVREADGGLQVQTPEGRVRSARMTADGLRLVVGAPSDSVQLPYVIVRDAQGHVRFLYRNARAYAKVP